MDNFTAEYTSRSAWKTIVNNNNLAQAENLLIQVFTPIDCPVKLQTLCQNIIDLVPNATLIGCTANGTANNQAIVGDSKTILIISQFIQCQVSAKHWQLGESHFENGIEIAASLVNKDTKAIIAFADGLKTNGEALLKGFNSIAPEIPITGGLAGDDWQFKQTFVIHQNQVLENSIVAVALNSDHLHVHSDYLFEWQPVGKEMTVTAADDNHLLSLDNIPVQKVYQHYLGLNEEDDTLLCAAEFPLMILRDYMSLARCPLSLGSDGSMYFAGNFSVNDKVRFCYAHSQRIQTAHALSIARMRSKAVEAAFIYGCGARKRFIPQQVATEIAQYQQLGDVAGGFLYGEFYHQNNKHAFLNHSISALFLSESDKGNLATDSSTPYQQSSTTDRLFNLIEVTSNELNELNSRLSNKVEADSKQLLTQQEKLQQAQKMEAIGQLTGGFAHDFNNILASIIGYTQLAQAQFGQNNDQLAKYLTTIDRASERAKELISKLLTFSRHSSNKAELTDIEKLFSDTATILAPTIPSSINLSFDCEKNLSPLFIDPNQFQQLLMSLVINARDALISHGNINVSIDIKRNIMQNCSSCGQDFSGTYLRLTVKDDGQGIIAANLKRIFEPFFTTKSLDKGSGMGLPVVHGIVHSHKGHIKVRSVAHQQTAFSIYFPYQERANLIKTETKVLVKNTTVTSSSENKLILIVDDEPLILDFLASYLNHYNFNVITAVNGRLALDKVNTYPIDLMITDQTMPEMTGVELSQSIRSLFPQLPIIISSGYSEEVNEQNIHQFGINHFIKKPAKPDQLLQAINALL